MTTPDQLATEAGALLAVWSGFMFLLVLAAAWIDWRLRRRRRQLPPPEDPRQQNIVALQQYRERRAALERLELRERQVSP